MYLIENHHEGIVSREKYDAVQAEMARRNAAKSPSKNAVTGMASYDRLLSAQCAPDAGFLAVVQRHAGTAWRSASLELDTERCDHGGRAARRGAPLVHPAGYSTESIQGGASANDRGFCVSGKCSRRKGRCVV